TYCIRHADCSLSGTLCRQKTLLFGLFLSEACRVPPKASKFLFTKLIMRRYHDTRHYSKSLVIRLTDSMASCEIGISRCTKIVGSGYSQSSRALSSGVRDAQDLRNANGVRGAPAEVLVAAGAKSA